MKSKIINNFLYNYDVKQQTLAKHIGYTHVALSPYLVGHKEMSRRLYSLCVHSLLVISRERKKQGKEMEKEVNKLIKQLENNENT